MSPKGCGEKMNRLEYLIDTLLRERGFPINDPHQVYNFDVFRSLVNMRPPKRISEEFLKLQDEMLEELIADKGITDIKSLTPIKDNLYIWQGDITTLKIDAIVNAGNHQLLGCFYPCHGCIDNAIHTFSGVQLRLECAEIMEKQNYSEETGKAKITNAYNLPSKYVIHTVGPIINGDLTKIDCKQLEDCYYSCMKIAEQNHLESIAFCCISTGEYHFPNEKAAEIAVSTVREYINETGSKMKVIFNVFKKTDFEYYQEQLR